MSDWQYQTLFMQVPFSTVQQYLNQDLKFYLNPTPQEIKDALKQIQARFPQVNISKIIETLYVKLTKTKKQHSPSMHKAHIVSGQLINYLQTTKKFIAKSFYYWGYGFRRFKQFMSKQNFCVSFDQFFYNFMCQSMVLQVYRYLQKILVKNSVKIKLKHYKTVRQLNFWIIKYKSYLDATASQLLLKLIAKTYNIQDVQFGLNEAAEIYLTLDKRFKNAQQTGEMGDVHTFLKNRNIVSQSINQDYLSEYPSASFHDDMDLMQNQMNIDDNDLLDLQMPSDSQLIKLE